MALEAIGDFLEHLEKNEKLAKDFFNSETPSEAIEIAKKAGYRFTAGELKMIFVKEAELSEEDLDAVAGGVSAVDGREAVDFERVEFLHDKLESIMKRVSG